MLHRGVPNRGSAGGPKQGETPLGGVPRLAWEIPKRAPQSRGGGKTQGGPELRLGTFSGGILG